MFMANMPEDQVQNYKELSEADKKAYEKMVHVARRDARNKKEQELAELTRNTERLAKKTEDAIKLQELNAKRIEQIEDNATKLKEREDELNKVREQLKITTAKYEKELTTQLEQQKEKEQQRTEARAEAAEKKRAAAANKAAEDKAASAKRRKKNDSSKKALQAAKALKLPLEHDVLKPMCDTHGCTNQKMRGASSWANYCSIPCKMKDKAGVDVNNVILASGAVKPTPPSAAAVQAAADLKARQQAADEEAAHELRRAKATQRAKAHDDAMRRDAASASTFMDHFGRWCERMTGCNLHPKLTHVNFNPETSPGIQTVAYLSKLGVDNMDAIVAPFMRPKDYDYEDKEFQTRTSQCAANHMMAAFGDIDADEITAIVTAILRHATAKAVELNCDITSEETIKLHRDVLEKIIVAAFKSEPTPGLHSMPEEVADQLAKDWDKEDQAQEQALQQKSKKRSYKKTKPQPTTSSSPKRTKGAPAKQHHGHGNAPHNQGLGRGRGAANTGVLYTGKRCKRTDCPCTATYNGQENEYCCMTCKEGERCDRNVHSRPFKAPGDCDNAVILYLGPACVNKHCHCTATWSGREGEYCTNACRNGKPCKHNVHPTPAKTKLWWHGYNLTTRK